MRRRLLIVDDEEPVLRALKRTLDRNSWSVVTATSGDLGLAEMERNPAQVVLTDYRMPSMTGVEFLALVKDRWPLAQRVMLTGHADPDAVKEAVNSGEVFRLMTKPWDDDQLVLTVTSAFEQNETLEENQRLARLTQAQNQQLLELARGLEDKVRERTLLLASAKRDWEQTFDAISSAVSLVRRDRTVKRANRAYARVARLDVAAVPGKRCYEALFDRSKPCDACPLDDAFEGAPPLARDLPGRGGRTFRVQAFVASDKSVEEAAVCVYEDVTEEVERNRQLMRTEKMAAIGRLAGGVAHEINNPLGAILAFSQIMKRDAGRSADDTEALGLIEESALRCKRIVGSLLTFARRSPFQLSALNPALAIEDTTLLFRTQLKGFPRAHLDVEIAPDLPTVMGDRARIEEALLNILQNALQALPEGVGSIRVTAGVEKGNVTIRVSDDGCGIPAEDLPRIFEPSFTTKPPGEGTGLGLAIVYGIIEEHRGRIDVASEVGRGTTFTIVLPPPVEGELRSEGGLK